MDCRLLETTRAMNHSHLMSLQRSFKITSLLVISVAIVNQLFYGSRQVSLMLGRDAIALSPTLQQTPSMPSQNFYNDTSRSFGACLLIKQDNYLLHEWIAYHYTVLPLRHLVIGSDEGNPEDPSTVVRKWSSVGLNYWIVNASNFAERHGPFKMSKEDEEDPRLRAHHALVHRQFGFLTVCAELLQQQGIQWTTFIDTDEYVAVNWNVFNSSVQANYSSLLQQSENLTFLDILKKSDPNQTSSCFNLPRVLTGALTNATCPDSSNQSPSSRINSSALTTFRFVQHANINNFEKNRFGKVLVDLSRIPHETVMRRPRSPHRPYADYCGYSWVKHPEQALFYLYHYIGGWEEYSLRSDNRRNQIEWQQRAYITDEVNCKARMWSWLPRFIQQVGETRAQYLLNQRDFD